MASSYTTILTRLTLAEPAKTYNPFAGDDFHPAKEVIRNIALQQSAGRLAVSLTGGLQEAKNLHDTIQTAKNLSDEFDLLHIEAGHKPNLAMYDVQIKQIEQQLASQIKSSITVQNELAKHLQSTASALAEQNIEIDTKEYQKALGTLGTNQTQTALMLSTTESASQTTINELYQLRAYEPSITSFNKTANQLIKQVHEQHAAGTIAAPESGA